MEENDVIEDIFGPDPAQLSSSEDNLQSEDDLFNELEEHASGESNSLPSDQSEEPTTENFSEEEDSSDDFTDKFLARIGIADKNAIPWQDASGAMYTRPWDSLTESEQLDILSSANTDPETDLDEEEINLINQIRQSGLTPSNYMQQYAQNIKNNFTLENKTEEIKTWSDEEVFALDLMQRLGDSVTDEEIEAALEKAKEDEEFFKKNANSIRNNLIAQQEQKNQQLQQEQYMIKEQEFQNLSNAIINELQQFNTVAGRQVELDNNDLNTLAGYILNRDAYGNTQYNLDMNSPQAIVHNAFWALYGPQFLQEAEAESARAFRRGYEQAQRDLNSQAAVEIRSTNKRKSNYFNT